MAWIGANPLKLADGLVQLPGPEQANAHLESVRFLRGKAVRFLAKPFQLTSVDFLDEIGATPLQFLILRSGAELLFGHGQVLSKRLDLQVVELHDHLEIVASRPQPFMKEVTGLVEPAGAAIETGEIQIVVPTLGIGPDLGPQR